MGDENAGYSTAFDGGFCELMLCCLAAVKHV